MLENSLHDGNVATAFAIAATTLDLTFTVEVAVAISAALSVMSQSKKPDKADAKSMVAGMGDYFDRSAVCADRKKIAA